MFTTLIIAALTLVLSLTQDSPFIVENLDKYVKEHVADDAKKDKIIVLLKDAKKKRKELVKKNEKLAKELFDLAESRETKNADFEQLLTKILDAQKESQKANIVVMQEAQNNITEEEWTAIQLDIAKSIKKSNKDRIKQLAKVEKLFVKWESNITKAMADEAKQKQAVAAVEEFKTVYIKNYKILQDELLNTNSVLYKYKASESELETLQKQLIDLVKEVYQTNVTCHFKLVELSTEDEWKKVK